MVMPNDEVNPRAINPIKKCEGSSTKEHYSLFPNLKHPTLLF
jgi:hypothetical protein